MIQMYSNQGMANPSLSQTPDTWYATLKRNNKMENAYTTSAQVLPTSFLLALFMIFAAFSTCILANAQSRAATASRIAGKNASS